MADKNELLEKLEQAQEISTISIKCLHDIQSIICSRLPHQEETRVIWSKITEALADIDKATGAEKETQLDHTDIIHDHA